MTNKAGVPNTRSKAEREEQRNKIVEARMQGVVYAKIAAELGCSISNARNIFKRYINNKENAPIKADIVYRLLHKKDKVSRSELVVEASYEIKRLRQQNDVLREALAFVLTLPVDELMTDSKFNEMWSLAGLDTKATGGE